MIEVKINGKNLSFMEKIREIKEKLKKKRIVIDIRIKKEEGE
jgi:hypothetical protein